MEAKDHFKNGASSKSQMSRRNFLGTWTKPVVLAFVIGIFTLTGCGKGEEFNNDCEAGFTDGLWLKMGDNSIVPTSDIDYYDVSTHIKKKKKKVPYLEKVGFDYGMMTVYVGKNEIYKCPFHPSYSSYMPQGVIISSPPFNKEDIIRIGFIQFLGENQKPMVTDPRDDKRIIAALKKYRQYHEGLHCKIQSIQVSNGKVVLNFELSNPDTFDYYYLDPNKMGFGLFHYFTNGPTFLDDPPTKYYTHKETIIHHDPWNSWKKEWLTLIKSGESKNISITYNQFDVMPAGKYRMYFEFPGLTNGISQKDLTLENGRIWLGSIGVNKDVTVH
jgi:hypothetical protein